MNYFFDRLVKKCYGCSNFGIKTYNGTLIYKKLGINLKHIKNYIPRPWFGILHDSDFKKDMLISMFTETEGLLYDAKLKKKYSDERLFLNLTGTIRSRRFLKGLPCNGQHTQTNAKTAREYEHVEKNRRRKERPEKIYPMFHHYSLINKKKRGSEFIRKRYIREVLRFYKKPTVPFLVDKRERQFVPQVRKKNKKKYVEEK